MRNTCGRAVGWASARLFAKYATGYAGPPTNRQTRRAEARPTSARLLTWLLALLGLAVSGCTTTTPRDFKPVSARFFLESGSGEGTPITLPQSGVNVVVNMKPVVTEGDLLNVELVQVDLGKCLMFQLTPSATRDFYRLSGAHQGRRLVLMLDDAPLGARRIDGAIANGAVFIFVERPDEALPALVQDLKQSFAALQRELAKKG